MNKQLLIAMALRTWLLATVSLSFFQQVNADVVVIDDYNNEVVLAEPAQRIISLAPHITELIFAAGAGDQLIGTVTYSDYPEAAKSVPIIGSFNQISYESVVALAPDLILAWGSGNGLETIDRLKSLGFKVYVDEPRQLEDVADSIRTYGLLGGHEETANAAASGFMLRLQKLRETYQDKDRISVFYQIWNDPLLTINGSHLISDVIRLCGGENIFADALPIAPKISIETVIRRNPAVIVASGMDRSRPEWLDDWKRWPAIEAVAKNHLYFIPPDILQRHTPRLLDGAEQLCVHLDQARTE